MRLALRFFFRDWRAGELGILLLALSVAVASVSSVSFFADRVHQALDRNAHQLLGADLLIAADQPLPDAFHREAITQGLAVAEGLTFLSMARAGADAQLVAVKAVGPGYPLRGRLGISESGDTIEATREIDHGPPPGVAWVEPRYASQAGLRTGDWLELGESRLRIAALLTQEPDRGVGFFNLAPRLMLNLADMPATGLIQPGSRISYQLYVAGESDAVAHYRNWLTSRLTRGQKMQGIDDARPEIRTGLDRAHTFLGLAALLAVILAAVAVQLATRRYVERHYDGYAVMRCLGARQRQLASLFGGQFLLLGGIAGVLGVIIGYAAQHGIGLLLREIPGIGLANVLPSPSFSPAAQGMATGYVLLLGFALPSLLRLKSVSTLRVLRREWISPRPTIAHHPALAYAPGFIALAGLLVWQSGAVKLASHALFGFLAVIAIFSLVSWAGLAGLHRLTQITGTKSSARSFAWRHALGNLRRRARSNILQIVSLALGLTAVLLLSFTQADLLKAWRATNPPDAPNRFVLNIQPEQLAPLLAFFRTERLPEPQLYPMVRGRLLSINHHPVKSDTYPDERTRRLVEREFNLSHMTFLPNHNRIIEGRWFDADDFARGGLSIELGIANKLGLKLGDWLTWSVAGENFSARISNFRKLDWDSMQVNFFVIATPGLLDKLPASYITSFHLPADQATAISRLTRAFPNLTVIDTSAILAQAANLIGHMSRAVQFVFLFALAAGILVLYTALLATRDERQREVALLRALGASRVQITSAQRIESLAVGLLAGLLSASGCTAIGALLASQVFEFAYSPNPWLWLAGPILGLLSVAINTWLGTRATLNVSPLAVLREG